LRGGKKTVPTIATEGKVRTELSETRGRGWGEKSRWGDLLKLTKSGRACGGKEVKSGVHDRSTKKKKNWRGALLSRFRRKYLPAGREVDLLNQQEEKQRYLSKKNQQRETTLHLKKKMKQKNGFDFPTACGCDSVRPKAKKNSRP